MKNAENKILFLGGGWNCFSNMSAYAVEINGLIFMTSEHAYQYEKFDDVKIKEEIFNARSAYDAKMLSIRYLDCVKSDWDNNKLTIMEKIIRIKLDQHPHIRKKLIETGDAEIIEDSKDDSFWGRGPDYKGLNNHGKIWMKLRKEIINGN